MSMYLLYIEFLSSCSDSIYCIHFFIIYKYLIFLFINISFIFQVINYSIQQFTVNLDFQRAQTGIALFQIPHLNFKVFVICILQALLFCSNLYCTFSKFVCFIHSYFTCFEVVLKLCSVLFQIENIYTILILSSFQSFCNFSSWEKQFGNDVYPPLLFELSPLFGYPPPHIPFFDPIASKNSKKTLEFRSPRFSGERYMRIF